MSVSQVAPWSRERATPLRVYWLDQYQEPRQLRSPARRHRRTLCWTPDRQLEIRTWSNQDSIRCAAHVRLRHRRCGLGRLRARQPADRGPGQSAVLLLEAGGSDGALLVRTPGPGQPLWRRPLRLDLLHRAAGAPRRPPHALAARQGARRHAARSTPWSTCAATATTTTRGATRATRLGLRRRPAVLQALREQRARRRRVPRRRRPARRERRATPTR